jgi:hypothetical protein
VAGSHHPEPMLGPSGQGTVVLDIGGGCGALVIWVPPSLDGAELELRPVGAAWQGQHTAVRPRDLGVGRRFAAVFGALGAGCYQLRVRGTDTGPITDVEVVGGTIAESTWPDRPGS